MRASSSDILQLPLNTKGHDFIVGDVHGCYEETQALMKRLDENPHHRIFFVGDLTDRGPNSLGVVRLVMQKSHENPGRVYVTMGNHEEALLTHARCAKDMLVDILRMIMIEPVTPFERTYVIPQTFKEKISKVTPLIEVYCGCRMGGVWVVPGYQESCNAIKALQTIITSEEPLPKNTLCELLTTCIESFIPELEEIADYFRTLPDIIVVGDLVKNKDDYFVVCHADMPFDAPTLADRLARRDLSLSFMEKNHVRYARPLGINNQSNVMYAFNPDKPPVEGALLRPLSSRASDVARVYVGHNIVHCDESGALLKARCQIGVFNIDYGAYTQYQGDFSFDVARHYGLMVVNHHENCAYLYQGLHVNRNVASVALTDYLCGNEPGDSPLPLTPRSRRTGIDFFIHPTVEGDASRLEGMMDACPT